MFYFIYPVSSTKKSFALDANLKQHPSNPTNEATFFSEPNKEKLLVRQNITNKKTDYSQGIESDNFKSICHRRLGFWNKCP